MTGSASGMGQAVAERLRAAGATVIGVDRLAADLTVDLESAGERRRLVGEALARTAVVDGLVACAGVRQRLPGVAGGADAATVVRVNYFGVIEPLVGLRGLLERSDDPRVAIVSSTGLLHVSDADAAAAACLDGDESAAVTAVGDDATLAYRASKRALAVWVRRSAAAPAWAGAGITVNAVAPGLTLTPMTSPWLEAGGHNDLWGPSRFPLGGTASPQALASLLAWLVSRDNTFMTGQVLFMDGGYEVEHNGRRLTVLVSRQPS